MAATPRIIIRILAIAVMAAAPVAGVRAASVNVTVNANVNKPLTLAAIQDLDFGQIVAAASGTSTVSISQTGVVTCGAGLTCSGLARPAIFNTTGSNGMVVRIVTAPSDLVNAANGSTIRFTPSAPASVTLTNSGAPGKDFNVGGSIAIPSTADGTYIGNVEVTVDYP